jgi:hypothetical protein
VTLYIMSSTNDTTRLSVASDISTYKFEMGRSDWSEEPMQSSNATNSVWSQIAHL